MKLEYQSLSELLVAIEDRANLNRSDGEPLYRYQTTNKELKAIAGFLKSEPRKITDKQPVWCAAFCLFAAEVFCAKHSGGAWAWEPLWDELGFELDPQRQLYPVLRKGLEWWKRPLIRMSSPRGSFRYLSTIALEGGLPRSLLQNAGSHLVRYLKALLKEYESFPGVDLEQIAQELDGHIPESLRKPTLHTLCANLIAEIVDLRQGISEDRDPIEFLNNSIPNWRERLPIRMDAHGSEDLITSLVRVQKAESNLGKTPTLRLFLNREGQVSVSRKISMPRELPEATLWPNSEYAPPSVSVFLKPKIGPAVRVASYISVVGKERYQRRGSQEYVTLPPESAFGSWALIASGRGEEKRVSLRNDYELKELPWVFPDTGTNEAVMELATGSKKTVNENIFIVLPRGVLLQGSKWKFLDEVHGIGHTLWRLNGLATADVDGDRYEFATRAEDESAPIFCFDGRILEVASTTGITWNGSPRLSCSESEDGPFLPVPQDSIEWKSSALGSEWQSYSASEGEGFLRVIEGGITKTRIPLTILNDFKVSILARAGEGELVIESNEVKDVRLEKINGVAVERASNPNGWEVRFRDERLKNELPLEVNIEICLQSGNKARVLLPIPLRKVVFVDMTGKALRPNSLITLNDLSGIRARVIGAAQGEQWVLEERSRRPRIVKPLRATNGWLEVSLFDLEEQIKCAFSSSNEGIDSEIELHLLCNGAVPVGESGSLFVCNFSTRVLYHEDHDLGYGGSVHLDSLGLASASENWAGVKMVAIPAWRPEIKPIDLECKGDDWWFDTSGLCPGPWLVFDDSGGKSISRPRLAIVPMVGDRSYPYSPATQLERALMESNEEDRFAQIDQALSQMGEDPRNSDWELMGNYFKLLDRLPANSFDCLARLPHNPVALAQAALSGVVDDADFDSWWSSMETLPFMWSLVPSRAWEQAAISMASEDALSWTKEDSIWAINRLRMRIENICPSVALLLEEILLRVFDTPVEGGRLLEISLNGPKSVAIRLEGWRDEVRRKHAGRVWPPDDFGGILAKSDIDQKADCVPWICSSSDRFANGVLNAPTVGAAFVAKAEAIPCPRIDVLKSFRCFDPRWFDQALDLQLIRILYNLSK
jgi:hypothetical protein